MKQRGSRSFEVFNISMLDVIFSALGAILILYIMSLQKVSNVESELKQIKADQSSLHAKNEQLKRENDALKTKLQKAKRSVDVFESMCGSKKIKYKIFKESNSVQYLVYPKRDRRGWWEIKYRCTPYKEWIRPGGGGRGVRSNGDAG